MTLDMSEIHIAWGMVADKDIASIIGMLPKHAHYYLCSPNVTRAMPIEQLEIFFSGFSYRCYKDVKSAYSEAYKNCKKTAGIYIGGSTFVVADFLQVLSEKK